MVCEFNLQAKHLTDIKWSVCSLMYVIATLIEKVNTPLKPKDEVPKITVLFQNKVYHHRLQLSHLCAKIKKQNNQPWLLKI